MHFKIYFCVLFYQKYMYVVRCLSYNQQPRSSVDWNIMICAAGLILTLQYNVDPNSQLDPDAAEQCWPEQPAWSWRCRTMLTRTASLILTLQNNVDPNSRLDPDAAEQCWPEQPAWSWSHRTNVHANSRLDPDRRCLMFTRTASLILLAAG